LKGGKGGKFPLNGMGLPPQWFKNNVPPGGSRFSPPMVCKKDFKNSEPKNFVKRIR